MRGNTVIFVVFCVVRTVHKCDFKLVINETPSKRLTVFVLKKLRHAAIKIHVFDRISMFALGRCREC